MNFKNGSARARWHCALEGGQLRFWSNLKVPFYVNLWHKSVIQDIQSHIWWMKKQIWCSKFSKDGPQKQENEKMPENSQIWACFGVFEQLNLFRLNFSVAVKFYFVHLLLIKMVGRLKSLGIAWNQVFLCQKCWFFTKSQSFLGEKLPVIKY